MTPSIPTRRRGREAVANQVVQTLGLAMALAGCVVLFNLSCRLSDSRLVASLGLYGLSLLMMLGFSTVYHLKAETPNHRLYECLDHIAIFIMIGGTYSPIALGAIGGSLGLGLFLAIWTVTLGGVLIRLFRPQRFERHYLHLYLGLGWLFVPALFWLPTEGMVLIAAGGLVYTLGVPFHHLDRLRYHTAIWHGFVVVAAALQYTAILRDVVLLRA
jgi:hemolysin III